MILTPGHASYPSGHATEAFAAAAVLGSVMKASGDVAYTKTAWRNQLIRLAARIAINRTVAGVHFPVDSAAGAVLGLTLARYFVARCTGAANYPAWFFDGSQYPPATDFVWHTLYDEGAENLKAIAPYSVAGVGNPQVIDPAVRSEVLKWLWDLAIAEWA